VETVNERLRRHRVEKSLTMKQVATAAGIPLSTYREWEYGRAIQGEPYLQLAQALSLTISELLTGHRPSSNALRAVENIEEHVKILRRILISTL
jgi:transcriptional regulator with XRE-family HTH domain